MKGPARILKRLRYRKVADGETVTIPRHGLMKMACCDCALVHVVRLRQSDRGFILTAWRDTRATASKRRARRA
jgi:hypothetical protein